MGRRAGSRNSAVRPNPTAAYYDDARSGIHPVNAAGQSPLGCRACVRCGTINLPCDRHEGNTIRRSLPETCAGCGASLTGKAS
jgi:hypothetical protein